mmetsp:Transcript_19811/g.44227  ORF Transcript_19811/g.44227 Transcript_19811/m.44227 type:complete len:93 (-) Transcript_19811:125-403(-)
MREDPRAAESDAICREDWQGVRRPPAACGKGTCRRRVRPSSPQLGDKMGWAGRLALGGEAARLERSAAAAMSRWKAPSPCPLHTPRLAAVVV